MWVREGRRGDGVSGGLRPTPLPADPPSSPPKGGGASPSLPRRWGGEGGELIKLLYKDFIKTFKGALGGPSNTVGGYG